MTKKDFYEILGVSEKATVNDIKKAYRELAKKYHPDRHPGDKTAEERFKQISEAHAVLTDPKKRAQYDQMRKLGAFGPGAGGRGFDFSGFDLGDLSSIFSSGGRRSSKRRGFSFEDFGNLGGLGDIFSQFFDQSNGYKPPKDSRATIEDLKYEVTVPFDTAMSGGKVQLTYKRKNYCSACGGTGSAAGKKPQKCPNCKGSGKVATGLGGFAVQRPCPQCLGRGVIISDPCEHCHGSGSSEETRKLSVSVKPGTEDGKTVRLAGQGNYGKGDLILKFKIGRHKFFEVKGLDVYCEVPVDFVQAALGTKIRVKTVTNQKVELKIPEGAQTGTLLKLKGLGLSKDGRKGDQYVAIRVETPTRLSDRQKEILQDFKRASNKKR